MEQNLGSKRKKHSPLLVFVSVFYLVFGAIFFGSGALACYGLILQGENIFASSSIVSLAVLLIAGLVMFVAGVRGLRNRGNYVLGFVMLLVGVILIVTGVTSNTFNWSSVAATGLGGLYLAGVKMSRR